MADIKTPAACEVDTDDARKGKYRQYQGPLGLVTRVIAMALPVYGILYVLDFFQRINIPLYSGAHNAFFLAFVLTLIFLRVPANRLAPRDRLPWYDLLLLAGSLVVTLYMGFNYEALLIYGGAWATPFQQVLGIVAIAILFEALRRTIGWPMVIIALAFFLYAKFAYLMPGILNGPEFSVSRVIAYTYLSTEGIFGKVLEIGATIILIFITFGAFLQQCGGAKFFFDLAFSLMGHVRGGPAKVSVFASALFGTMTGSPVANVGVTGSITIPLMKRVGYAPHFAAAVESVASTGGALMPPVMGAVAFLIADFTRVGYGQVALAALIPAILYFLSVYLQVDLEAGREGLKGLPREQLPTLTATLGQGWFYLLPLGLLVVLLMVLRYDPLVSALYSLALLIVVSFFRPETRLTLTKLGRALEDSAYGVTEVGALTAVAGIITAAVAITGLGVNLSAFLVSLSGGSLALLAILTGITCYILGMGISSIAAYILLAVLVAPAMAEAGLPVLVAHFFIFYMGLSTFITPPHCSGVFVAAGIAGSEPFKTAFRAMRLGVVCYLVPFIIVFNPALMLVGAAREIALATVTAVVGVVALSVGIEGFIRRIMAWWERLPWLAGGLLLMVPGWGTDLPGLAFLAAGAAIYWWRSRHIFKTHMNVATTYH